MKISKKRQKMIEAAISDAFDYVVDEYLDKSEIDQAPENWMIETKEIWDMLSTMQYRCLSSVFKALDIGQPESG